MFSSVPGSTKRDQARTGQKRKTQEKQGSSGEKIPNITNIAMDALAAETTINDTWAQTLDSEFTPLEAARLRHSIDSVVLAAQEKKLADASVTRNVLADE